MKQVVQNEVGVLVSQLKTLFISLIFQENTPEVHQSSETINSASLNDSTTIADTQKSLVLGKSKNPFLKSLKKSETNADIASNPLSLTNKFAGVDNVDVKSTKANQEQVYFCDVLNI